MQMRRQRTVRPDLMSDPRLTSVPPAVRFFALGLMLWADDHGRGELLPNRMRRDLLPHDDQVTPDRVEEMMLQLDEAGFVELYADEDGRTLFQIAPDILGTVDRRSPSVYPPSPFASGFANRVANRVANRGLGEGEREWSARERARERVEFESEGDESVRLPPHPFCEKHPSGTNRSCRHCGTARLRHDQWKRHAARGEDTSRLECSHDDEEPDNDGWGDPF